MFRRPFEDGSSSGNDLTDKIHGPDATADPADIAELLANDDDQRADDGANDSSATDTTHVHVLNGSLRMYQCRSHTSRRVNHGSIAFTIDANMIDMRI